MRYGSVCSGVEAATMAWHQLGWEPAFFSEIEAFPRAVLKHRYPDVPLHGDFTTIGADEYGAIDLLVGGTPCQSFSVAGLRKGMDDDRGNLALEFLRLAQRKRPAWVVWENVPGVLSSNKGRDFGSFLGGLGELGYGWAYRVLDAQYFGVAQRRRRVFVVGHLGDERLARAVLFERHSLQGHPAPGRKKRQGAAPDVAKCLGGNSGGIDREDRHTLIPDVPTVMSSGQANAEITEDVSPTLNCNRDGSPIAFAVHGTQDPDVREEHTHTLGRNSGQENAIAFKSSHYTRGKDGAPSEITPPLSAEADKGDQDTLIFQPRYVRNGRGAPDSIAGPLTAQAGQTGKGDSAQCVVFDTSQVTHPENRSNPQPGDPCHTLTKDGKPPTVAGMQVRRLTPVECERLQGFPDNFTQVPYRGKTADQCPDGPRYKAMGNSMAVPVMHWIGDRIGFVSEVVFEATGDDREERQKIIMGEDK